MIKKRKKLKYLRMKRKMLRIPHPPPFPQVEKELFEVYNKWNNIIHFALLLLSPWGEAG